MAKNTRIQRLADDQKLIDGVVTYLSQSATLTVGSQTLAPADIVKLLKSRIVAGQAVVPAKAGYEVAVKTERDARAKTSTLVSALRRVVQGMFSQSPDTLAAFGLTPAKAPKTSAVTKAQAVVKRRATRKARGTMGSEQKEAVTGAPQGNPVTPPAAKQTP